MLAECKHEYGNRYEYFILPGLFDVSMLTE